MYNNLSVAVEKQLAIHAANVKSSFKQPSKVRYTLYYLLNLQKAAASWIRMDWLDLRPKI